VHGRGPYRTCWPRWSLSKVAFPSTVSVRDLCDGRRPSHQAVPLAHQGPGLAATNFADTFDPSSPLFIALFRFGFYQLSRVEFPHAVGRGGTKGITATSESGSPLLCFALLSPSTTPCRRSLLKTTHAEFPSLWLCPTVFIFTAKKKWKKGCVRTEKASIENSTRYNIPGREPSSLSQTIPILGSVTKINCDLHYIAPFARHSAICMTTCSACLHSVYIRHAFITVEKTKRLAEKNFPTILPAYACFVKESPNASSHPLWSSTTVVHQDITPVVQSASN
jgi:hypothetical protein